MKTEYRDELEKLGVDVAEGVDRVMGDADLYEMMLGMFVDSVRDASISLADFEKSDTEELTRKVHMLKGMTGNLSLTSIFNDYVEVLGLLRGGKAREAQRIMAKLLGVQEKIVACIEKNKA